MLLRPPSDNAQNNTATIYIALHIVFREKVPGSILVLTFLDLTCLSGVSPVNPVSSHSLKPYISMTGVH